MFCGFPIDVHGRLRPCGKCQGCLRRRRRAWVARMLCEQTTCGESAFVTLTLEDSELSFVKVEGEQWLPTLVQEDLQKYLRRVRDLIRPKGLSLRHFACGEYGEKTGRPHYHLIAFGLGAGAEDIFADSWKKGFVSVYEANAKTMAYVAKYCLKGCADPELALPGLPGVRSTEPPFRLMSRNPPIGAGFAKSIAGSLTTRTGSHVLVDGDIHLERVLRFRGEFYPLDRTMRDRVQDELAIPAAMADSLFRRDFEEPTDEATQASARVHIKAQARRHAKAKL